MQAHPHMRAKQLIKLMQVFSISVVKKKKKNSGSELLGYCLLSWRVKLVPGPAYRAHGSCAAVMC